MRFFLTLFVFCLSFSLFSQVEKDYRIYHTYINKAEKFYFVDNNTDSTFYYYDKAFSEYDFIFLKDLVNASQLAYYSKLPYKKYIEKGFEFGLKLSHLKSIEIFKPIISNLESDKGLSKLYKEKRKLYVSKLNVEKIDWVYKIGIQDQKDKYLSDKNYKIKQSKSVVEIQKFISKYGYPGEKIIGIADSTIFREIKSSKIDFHNRIKHDSLLKKHFVLDEEYLSEELIIITLIHNFDSYKKLKYIWLEQIKKGNIHPRDVALIHDNTYRDVFSDKNDLNGYYKNNIFCSYPSNLDIKRINKIRRELFICSYDLDKIKEKKEKEIGFKLFWGFWNCR